MTTPFPHLFSPLKVGSYTLKNRIMNTGHAAHFQTADGIPTERYADYVGERAKGGSGIIVTGHTIVVPDGEISLSLSSSSDKIIPSYQRMAAATHAYDVPLLAQLGHRGRRPADSATFNGRSIVGPSAVPPLDFSTPMHVPHVLRTDEVEALVDAFTQGAVRAVKGDLDGIELTIGMDFLLANFLHGQANRRQDKYGGDTLEERMTFLREILLSIRNEIGTGKLIGVRMYDDQSDYSLQLPEHIELAKLLEREQLVDYLNIWQGMVSSPKSGRTHWPSYYYPPASFVNLSAAIKAAVSLPVVGTGRMDSPALAEQALASGKADIVGMARTLIADPHFPNKAKAGKVEDIRSCIACTQACVGHIYMGLGVSCIYNPVTGREQEWSELPPAEIRKKILIIGAGPAGMEAARVAATRGHSVTLIDRGSRMGGQINLVMKTPNRGNFEEIILWFERQLPKLGVEIRLRTEATEEMINASGADEIIFATGSRAYVPEIEGIDGANVFTARDVLQGTAKLGERILVVDTIGRSEAATTADYLADRGYRVELITGMSTIAQDMPPPVRHNLIEKLISSQVQLTTSKGVWSISEDGVDVYNVVTWDPDTIEVDSVVFGSGGISDDTLYHALRKDRPTVHAIGDCYQTRDIEIAIVDGHRLGRDV